MITMELYRQSDHFGTSDDFYDRCVTCTNFALMKGEYQAKIDSIRECLPSKRGRGVCIRKDPMRQEQIGNTHQIKFIETCIGVNDMNRNDESVFQQHDEIGRYGLGPYCPYPFTLRGPRVLPVDAKIRSSHDINQAYFSNLGKKKLAIKRCLVNGRHISIEPIKKSLSNMEKADSKDLIDMIKIETSNINSILANSRPYYPFRITHWIVHSQSKLTSYFVSARDNAGYQSGDCAGIVDEHNKKKLQVGNKSEQRWIWMKILKFVKILQRSILF